MGIKIQDVAFVRFYAPDLDAMEAFLTEFGMIRAERSGDMLYMRGLDTDPFLHVTRKGEPGFAAVGFEAASQEDLRTLANAENAPVENLDGPGGGQVIRLSDPNGFRVEVVAGRRGAGDGKTDVGQRRAADVANGERLGGAGHARLLVGEGQAGRADAENGRRKP